MIAVQYSYTVTQSRNAYVLQLYIKFRCRKHAAVQFETLILRTVHSVTPACCKQPTQGENHLTYASEADTAMRSSTIGAS